MKTWQLDYLSPIYKMKPIHKSVPMATFRNLWSSRNVWTMPSAEVGTPTIGLRWFEGTNRPRNSPNLSEITSPRKSLQALQARQSTDVARKNAACDPARYSSGSCPFNNGISTCGVSAE